MTQTDVIPKMELNSMNIQEDQLNKLKAIFPEVFNEDKVDWEKLQRSLGEVMDSGDERFGMTWPGKSDCFRVIQEPSIGTLKPCKEESVNWDSTENLFIEGDNLEVLKLLQQAYYNKVKMIYIDPPYNTGKEFIYPDNYTENLQTYLNYSGQLDDKGYKFSSNTDTDGRFHSKWMNMMYPRLFLARNLLKEDGVIFISIDDHEVDNLKKICNEVFGEENFIAELVWERAFSPKNDAKYISNSHDYVLMYVKSIESFKIGRLPRTEEADARYKNPDNDPRGVWQSSDISVKTYNAECDYPITAPSGRVIEPPTGRCWRLSKKGFLERLHDNRIWFGSEGDGVPRIKRFLTELKYDGMAPQSIMFYKDVGHSQEGAQEVTALLEAGAFDGPKPLRLLNRLLTLANIKEDDTILDFFAGSASTAHAVMQFNFKNNKKQKYIMVQLPEACDEKSEAFKAGFKTIADIGKERIRRAAKKIDEENPDYKGDLGFKVYKLDQSNFKVWDGQALEGEALTKQLETHIDHIIPGSTDEAVLYEILLKAGYPLTTKIETLTLADKTVYSIADDALLLCLDRKLNKGVITEMAKREPSRVVCLDLGFTHNDQLKTNAVQIMKSHDVKDFQTV